MHFRDFSEGYVILKLDSKYLLNTQPSLEPN